MEIIVKRHKSSGLKHLIMSKKKFKSKVQHHTTNHMTKKHKGKSHKSSGFGSKLKIPVIGKYINNPTVQKVAKAAGTVAIVGAVVQLANIPQVNSIWNNQIVRSAVAYTAGDFIGAAGTYALENPSLLNMGRGSTPSQSMAGYA